MKMKMLKMKMILKKLMILLKMKIILVLGLKPTLLNTLGDIII